jgi:hypothetical protein
MKTSVCRRALLVLALAITGCARGATERPAGDSAARGAPPAGTITPAPADSVIAATPGGPAPADSDLAAVRRLEAEARALARTDGCASAAQCAVAPVGDRPCGGPRTYVAYCRLTTDSAALFRKLDELARRERAYNEKAGLASTCEFRQPPVPALEGGRCRTPGTP